LKIHFNLPFRKEERRIVLYVRKEISIISEGSFKSFSVPSISLSGHEDFCGDERAACLDDGRKLSSPCPLYYYASISCRPAKIFGKTFRNNRLKSRSINKKNL
jgi:hypothetical protein